MQADDQAEFCKHRTMSSKVFTSNICLIYDIASSPDVDVLVRVFYRFVFLLPHCFSTMVDTGALSRVISGPN